MGLVKQLMMVINFMWWKLNMKKYALDDLTETLNLYFETFDKDNKPWLRRKSDGFEIPVYILTGYPMDIIEDIGQGKFAPKFLQD